MAGEAISSERAPRAVGPYSQAMRAGDLVLCAGQVGLDPATGDLVAGGVATETRRALENVSAVLEAAGLSLADVVKTTVYLTSIDDFAAMNDVYAAFFHDPLPARSTVGVAALPKGAAVEIEAVAWRRQA